jgi:hypothetical protein
VQKLIAVFPGCHVLENCQVFEKMTPHKLLGDGRSAMREDRLALHRILSA